MTRPRGRSIVLTPELLEDRLTPTVSFGTVSGGETAGSDALSVATGDLSGNGRQDMVIGTSDGVEIFMNNGDGTFTETGDVNFGVAPDIVKLADMTGNGKLDLVIGSTSNNEIIICLGNGNGTFQIANAIVENLAYNVQDMAVADLNGDGLPDVVAAIPGGAAVLLNNGTSSILNAPTYYNPSNQPDQAYVAIGDFNGNGKPDIAISVYSQNLIDVYPNNGNGTFGTPTPYDDPASVSGSPGHLLTGDFNNDGKLDLVVGYEGTDEVGLLEGNGNGTFQNPLLINTTVSTSIIAAADFDKDGNLDLVEASESPYYDVVLPGNGDGTFGTPIQVNSVADGSSLAIADVNGDGLPDLIAVGRTSPGSYSVAINNSTVQFGQTSASFASPQVASGGTDTITIDVNNVSGKPVSDLSNSDFTLSFSGGTSTGTIGNVTATTTPGVYTASFAGNQIGTAGTLSVSIDGIEVASEPTVAVVSNVPASTSTVHFAGPTVHSGLSDTTTIVLKDPQGYAIAGLPSSDFSFSFVGGTSTGSFGTVTQTSTPGTYTANFTGVIAGTAKTLVLRVNGVAIATHPTVAVTPGAVSATESTASFTAPSDVSGKLDRVVIVAKDAAGNAIPGLSGNDFILGLLGGSSTGSFGTVTATTVPGVYTTTFTGYTAGTASSLTATVNGNTINAQPTVTVETGTVSAKTSSAMWASSTVASGTTDTLTLVVKDAAGNAITGLTRSAFALVLTGGKSTGTFGTFTATETPGTYTIEFTGVLAGTASATVVRIDGVLLTSHPSVQVTPGAVNGSKSTVTIAKAAIATGGKDVVTIVARDAAGNLITNLTSGDFILELSGGTSVVTWATVTKSSTPGVYTVVLTGETAGTPTELSVEVSDVMLSKTPKVTVIA